MKDKGRQQAPIREREVVRRVREALEAAGAWAIKLPNSPWAALPWDVLACLPGGRLVAVEAKIRGRHLQAHQLAALRRVARLGAAAAIAWGRRGTQGRVEVEMERVAGAGPTGEVEDLRSWIGSLRGARAAGLEVVRDCDGGDNL